VIYLISPIAIKDKRQEERWKYWEAYMQENPDTEQSET